MISRSYLECTAGFRALLLDVTARVVAPVVVSTFGRLAVLTVLVSLFVPNATGAQGVGGGNIAGVVRDTSGAVLPGVTVEAASPALIEKVRSVVTDGNGRYQIVDLRPGTYAVNFTLPGFRTVRREGIELATGFTATVNADLAVGAVEETVTVTGEAPLVDTRNTTQQEVLSGEVVRDLPIGKNSGAIAAVMAAAIVPAANQDVGGTKGEIQSTFSVHGSRNTDMLSLRDGMLYNTMLAGLGNNVLSSINPVTIQETQMQITGGLSAEATTGGAQINTVPRDGGNRTALSFSTDFSHSNLQGNNIDDELRARGATVGNEVKRLYDVAGGVGGPIAQNRLWYFASSRYWIGEVFYPNNFFNALQGKSVNGLPAVFYQPDTSRPAFGGNFATEGSVRLTWQANDKNKFTYTPALERNCNCRFGIQFGFAAPEAVGDDFYWPYHRHQANWQSPVNSRLLLQAGYLYIGGAFIRRSTGGDPETDYSVIDLTRFYHYGNSGNGLGLTQGYATQDWAQYNFNGSLSYVTGSHAFKVGGLLLKAPKDYETRIPYDVHYNFLGSAPPGQPGAAVPLSVTFYATPFGYHVRMTQTGAYVQDQWTLDRLTLNLGLRYDGLNAYTPAEALPAGPWVGARNFPKAEDIPNWHDINPRVGAAYDLFGNGRTAVKFNLGRFILYEPTSGVPQENNPANLMVTSATRVWRDANQDYVPQESELGPYDNSRFGTLAPGTQWDPAVLDGWHVRPYNWQTSVSVEHQLTGGLALNVGYFRTWYGNHRITDNRAVTAADFDSYCVTVPSSSSAPGNGQQVCGFTDVKPAFFGKVDNFVTKASNYGKYSEVYNGVDVTVSARVANGGVLTGGLSTGRTVLDNCEILEILPETLAEANGNLNPFCRREPSWDAATAFKLGLSTPIPGDFQLAVNYQNNPGVDTQATWSAGTAEVSPSLGRPLASNGRATLVLVEPSTVYREGRINQLNVALSRNFRMGGRRGSSCTTPSTRTRLCR